MGEPDQVEARLVAAVAARAERDALLRRLTVADRQVGEAQRRVVEASARLAGRKHEERVDHFSFGRVVAGFRETRAMDLERLQAEQQVAWYAHAEAVVGRARALRHRLEIKSAINALGDVDQEYELALEATERWLGAAPGGHGKQLLDLAQRRGELAGLAAETEEALDAGHAASSSLDQARAMLSSAEGWASWDLVGGGGLINESIGHDLMDRAAQHLRRAEAAMQKFARELGDLTGSDLTQPALTRVFDTFLDNVLTDFSVRRSITDAAHRVEQAYVGVAKARSELENREAGLVRERFDLDRRREQLLQAEGRRNRLIGFEPARAYASSTARAAAGSY
jgi:hypothetical protein